MIKLSKEIKEVLENHNIWRCGEISDNYGEGKQYDIELETYSPEGEDVIIPLVYDGTDEDFVKQFNDYAEDFDVDDHVEMWIEGRGKNGVPKSILDLVKDAEWQKNMFLNVANELNRLGSKETDIEELWLAACSGNINTLKQYYESSGKILNRRYHIFNAEHSLIMGALRNNRLDTVKYLLDIGETVTEKEKVEIQAEIKRLELLKRIGGR